jgi:glyoxylase-like metal-dependent hydrolase (beta-lactamase superfamily II)
MKIATIRVTPLLQNCTVMMCEDSGKACIVDPGGNVERILAGIAKLGAVPELILLTHGHVDHCGGTAELASRVKAPVKGPHCDDAYLIERLPERAAQFGLAPAQAFTPDAWLAGGDTLTFGNVELEVRHCPGHTPGHVVYFAREARLALVGDVLFRGSIGRTDLPRGDHAALIRSIRTQLWPLGDDVTFIPGHGPASTFGIERATNPYVADGA